MPAVLSPPAVAARRVARLNGPGASHSTTNCVMRTPADVADWPLTIEVPFAPESRRSGIGDTGFHRACWYQRDFESRRCRGAGERRGRADPALRRGRLSRTRLGQRHPGGRARRRPHAVLCGHHARAAIRAVRSVSRCAWRTIRTIWKSRAASRIGGSSRTSIWYPRTTGIWQTVWLEACAATRTSAPCNGRRTWNAGRSRFTRCIGGERADDLQLVSASELRRAASSPRYLPGRSVARCIAGSGLSDPGIDDYRNELLWSPERPDLIDAEIKLMRGEDVIDEFTSYTALRSIGTQRERLLLNGRPLTHAAGAGPGILARHVDDGAVGRRPATRCRAREGDGLQRRAQAPEDRGSALSVLGRRARACWCGRRCRAPTASPRKAIKRLVREWTEAIERDIQPSVRRDLGAVQRILGRARLDAPCPRRAMRLRRSIT